MNFTPQLLTDPESRGVMTIFGRGSRSAEIGFIIFRGQKIKRTLVRAGPRWSALQLPHSECVTFRAGDPLYNELQTATASFEADMRRSLPNSILLNAFQCSPLKTSLTSISLPTLTKSIGLYSSLMLIALVLMLSLKKSTMPTH